MKTTLFYDELTCRYFRDSKEHIENCINRVNETYRGLDCYTSLNDMLNDLYIELGMGLANKNYGSSDSPREISYDDLFIHEVNPETNSKENDMENEKEIIDFKEFNVEATTRDFTDPITLVFTTSEGKDIKFTLTKTNAKTMIKFLKAAVKLV